MTLVIKNTIRDEIGKQEIFNRVDISEIEPVLKTCDVEEISAGATLIQAGQANHDLYLILEGRLRVHLANDMASPIATLEQGQSVGEVSIIDHQPASAHVIADTDTRLLKISEDKLWRLVESSHAIANNMLVILSQRLRYGNTVINKIKELLREYEYNATVDPLTSLYNRRWLDNMLERVMQRCNTNNQPLSVIMIDIDFFKQFNDNHGHLAGDSALRAVARSVLQSLRPEDLVTRYGGEE
ncbi:MAG: GGDEF domain-containing protein, partial [Thiotrichales bacterium]|nr:GGDEF domain-containing protein [Thiotrichales bacterium]